MQSSAKNTVKLSVIFTLLGYVSVKAASRILMKLTPDDGIVGTKGVGSNL